MEAAGGHRGGRVGGRAQRSRAPRPPGQDPARPARAECAPQASGAAAQPSPTRHAGKRPLRSRKAPPPRRPALRCSDWSYFQNKARPRRWGRGEVTPVCRNSEREHGAEGPGGSEGLREPSVSAPRSQGPLEFHLKHVPGIHGHVSSRDAASGLAPPRGFPRARPLLSAGHALRPTPRTAHLAGGSPPSCRPKAQRSELQSARPAPRGTTEPGLCLRKPVSWLETPETGRCRAWPWQGRDTLHLPVAQRLSEEAVGHVRPQEDGVQRSQHTHSVVLRPGRFRQACHSGGGGGSPKTSGEKQGRWGRISLKARFQGCSWTPLLRCLGWDRSLQAPFWPAGWSQQSGALLEGRAWAWGTSCRKE